MKITAVLGPDDITKAVREYVERNNTLTIDDTTDISIVAGKNKDVSVIIELGKDSGKSIPAPPAPKKKTKKSELQSLPTPPVEPEPEKLKEAVEEVTEDVTGPVDNPFADDANSSEVIEGAADLPEADEKEKVGTTETGADDVTEPLAPEVTESLFGNV